MDEKSRRPEDTPFKQQKLKAWQPILTPNWVIGTFFVVGLIFIPIGIILRVESDRVVEYSIQYDGAGALTAANGTQGQYTVVNAHGSTGCQLGKESDGNKFNLSQHSCLLRFTLDQDMKAPIYVYYQLDNFYQNHRRYVASRSDEQLRGTQPSSLSDCDPLIHTPKNTLKYDSISNTAPENGTWQLNPCGLIANSMFNDIFWVNSITSPSGQWYGQVASYPTSSSSSVEVVNLMVQTGIAWQSDIDAKFDNIPAAQRLNTEMYLWQNPNYRYIIPAAVGQARVLNETAWTTPQSTAYGVKSEHFIVWMRTAGLPNFRKLYGHIDSDLPKGTTLEFLVSSNFVVNSFEGKKSLVLSTTSWFGGRNPFLGIAYITVGSLCMVLSILFFAKHKLSPRKLGDTRYLVWKNNHNSADAEPSKRPDDTPFKQQRLKAWQPILTPNWVIGTFFLVGLIFIPIGVFLFEENQNITEMAIQYDGVNLASGAQSDGAALQNISSTGCYLKSASEGNMFNISEHGCIVQFTLQSDMKAPIMVYYQLDNFYQNHRRYVSSRSDAQLRGDADPNLSTCSGATMSTTVKYNSTAELAPGTATASYKLNPCGLIANSLFNDLFWINSLTTPDGTYLGQTDAYKGKEVVNLMSQSGLAWKSDIESKFKNPSSVADTDLMLWQNSKYRNVIPAYKGQERILNVTGWTEPAPLYGVETERFIVWMRTAGLPNFRKLYGRIETDLPKGTVLRFLVSSNFPVTPFEGKKSLVISTLSWYGGRNPFLGVAYMVIGSICIVLSLIFFAKHKMTPRKLGDTNYLVWKAKN
ncbi:hypothetical protein ACHHYP_05042 [Achlya hypogyna]|uniref:ALA-interacting subunit n=1 Tax=Achlya hypogyna TaxID=1202772 RepID=A0A1V9YZG8_ACHHY|nr:hypothetical protein ACHHYP_05042 [Achlya hypogyna]